MTRSVHFKAQAVGRDLELGGTVPGVVHQAFGGVGRNVAQALAQLCRLIKLVAREVQICNRYLLELGWKDLPRRAGLG